MHGILPQLEMTRMPCGIAMHALRGYSAVWAIGCGHDGMSGRRQDIVAAGHRHHLAPWDAQGREGSR